MNAYLDTSALVKLAVEEPGTDELSEQKSEWTVLGAVSITYAELRAAVAGLHRTGRLTAEAFLTSKTDLEDAWREVTQIDIGEELVQEAGEFAERYSLRGYDAIQLAGLRAFDAPGRCVLACWDKDMRAAATKLGYEVFPTSIN